MMDAGEVTLGDKFYVSQTISGKTQGATYQIDIPTGKKTDIQTDRQTDRQTDLINGQALLSV